MSKGPFSPSFVQSDGEFLFWNPETQKREACGTACTKSQGGETCEKTKWVSGTRCAGCHSESRMKTIIIRCWKTWPAAVFDPAPPPSCPPALPSSAPAHTGGGGCGSPCLTTRSSLPHLRLGTTQADLSPLVLCPPNPPLRLCRRGLFVSMTSDALAPRR